MKKVYFFIITFFLLLPQFVLAAEEKSAFHVFYERSFGPVGAIAGIIAMVAFWQMSKKVEKNFSYLLKMVVLVLLLVNIGSLSFGIHGAGILDGETSRYVERICRLIALLVADVAALALFLRLNKKDTLNKENQMNIEGN